MENNSFNFKQAAQQAVTLCSLMVGREKLDTSEVVNQELTIIAFDFAPKFDDKGSPIIDSSTGEIDTYGVVIFDEIPGRYYCVGAVFTKVCKMWAEPFENAEEASRALALEGGVKVKFTNSKTKAGKNLTAVTIL